MELVPDRFAFVNQLLAIFWDFRDDGEILIKSLRLQENNGVSWGTFVPSVHRSLSSFGFNPRRNTNQALSCLDLTN
jgi:hypothetical protein